MSNPAADQVRAIVERIERLRETRAGVDQDIAEAFSEAKGSGFDVKILKALITRRARDKNQLTEEEALLDLYESAMRDTDQKEANTDG